MRNLTILFVISAFFLTASPAIAVIDIDTAKYHQDHVAARKAREEAAKYAPTPNPAQNRPAAQKQQPKPAAPVKEDVKAGADAAAISGAETIKAETIAAPEEKK